MLRRDVHPAEVLLPNGTLITAARVFVLDRRLVAFVYEDGQIVLKVNEPLVEPELIPADHGTLQGALECHLPDGIAWVNRGSGCGCGSPLKALPIPDEEALRDVVHAS